MKVSKDESMKKAKEEVTKYYKKRIQISSKE